jgi:glutathione S-transferase
MQVFGDRSSGNYYKVELMCSILKIDHDWVDIDVLAGETQKTIFRKLNPNGKIPLVTLRDGNTLAESNAILGFLAEGTPWMPSAGIARAKTYEWLFFEQYSHEPYIAVARFIQYYQNMPAERVAEYKQCKIDGAHALNVMEHNLSKHAFFGGATPSIADIALFAYTHVADQGGFDLQSYPAISRWILDMQSVPGYTPIRARPV